MSATVLFDLDGTLVDTRALYAAAYTRGFAAELATPPTFDELIARRPSAERHLLVDWYGPEVGERIHRRVVEAYAELAPTLLTGFYPGVEGLLSALRERGARLGVVTGKSRAAHELTAAQLDFSAFEVVVVEDDTAEPKPDPSGIRLALERLGVGPESAVYVGDTEMDLEASWAARVQPAAALWGRDPASRAWLRGEASAAPPERPGPAKRALNALLTSARVPKAWALEEPSALLAELERAAPR